MKVKKKKSVSSIHSSALYHDTNSKVHSPFFLSLVRSNDFMIFFHLFFHYQIILTNKKILFLRTFE